MLTIVSSSLRPESNSRVLAAKALEVAHEACMDAQVVDLRDYEIPHCDGEGSSSHADVRRLEALFAASEAVIFCTPIYNYDASPVLQNLVANVGDALEGKVIGLLAAAGGTRSYLAPLGFLTTLMAHFRCLIVPRYVYAPAEVFKDGVLADDEVRERVREVVAMTHRLGRAVCSMYGDAARQAA